MSIVRSLIGYAPAVVLPRIVSLVLVLILTRLISREEYGLYVLVMTFGEMIDGVVSNWVRIALARFASAPNADMAREARRCVLVHAITFLLAVAIAAIIGVTTRPERSVEFILAMVIYMAAIAVQRIPSTIMSVENDRTGIIVMEAGKGLGLLVFGIAATWVSPSFFLQTLAFAAVTGSVGVWGLLRCWPSRDPEPGLVQPLRALLTYGLPIIPAAIATTVLASSDRLFLDRFVGPEAVALYAAGVMLARQPLDFLFSLAGVRVFPLLMESFERGGADLAGRRLAELLSGVTFITLPAVIGVILVAEPMTGVLLAHDYVGTARTVLPLAAAAAMVIGYKSFVFDQIFHMVKRNGLIAALALPGAVIGLVAFAVCVPLWGVWGCALAYLLQCVGLLAASVVVTRRFVPIPVPWSDIVRIAAATAIMAAVLLLARFPLAPAPMALRLVVEVVVGILAYGAAVLVLRPTPVDDFLPARFRRSVA